ncbi:MAG: hypothetical protein ACOC8B_04380 [Gemmatimonadota bacterium]
MYARSHHNQKRSAGARAGRWLATAMAALALAACDETPVSLPTASDVVVGTEAMTLYAGTDTEIAASVVDQDGQVMRLANAVWSSSDPSVVAIMSQASGEARIWGESTGEATLTASYGEMSAEVVVTVVEDDREMIRSFSFFEESIDVDIKQPDPIAQYLAYDGFGDREDCLSDRLTVESSDPSIADATVAACHVVVNLNSPGTATLTGTVEGVSAEVTVNVSDGEAVAYFIPETHAPEAGDVVTYQVKVADKDGDPLEGHTVNFSAEYGSLDASSVETNAQGVASVDWTAPSILTDIGEDADIGFATTLPGDEVVDGFINQTIDTGDPDEIRWYVEDELGNWDEITGGSITLDLDQEYRIIANLYDANGNLIETDGSISSDDGGIVNGSGPNQNYEEGELSSNSPWIDVESAAETTATLTADLDDDGENPMSDDLAVEFVDNS